MQRPYGAGRGPAGPAWSDSDRTATAGGCGGARNAISRSDPMHWGAGQWGAGHWGAGQWEAGRKGRVQTGGGGWRLRPGTECEIRAKTLWSGSRPRGPGWPAFGRPARPTVVAGRGMRFPCKDPRVKRPRACLLDRGAGRGDWAGRVRTGRRGRQTGAVPRRVAGARLAGTNAMNVKNSAATPYNGLPPGTTRWWGPAAQATLAGGTRRCQRRRPNDTVQITTQFRYGLDAWWRPGVPPCRRSSDAQSRAIIAT
jgi:hypothetical protein